MRTENIYSEKLDMNLKCTYEMRGEVYVSEDGGYEERRYEEVMTSAVDEETGREMIGEL